MLVNYTVTALSWILFFAGLAALVAAYALWRRRESPGALYLGCLQLAASVWSITYGWETAALTLPLKTFWGQASYIGIATAPAFFFLFATAYAGRYRWHRRPYHTLLFVLPVITLALAATNNWHHWYWPEVTLDPATNLAIYGHGIPFWIFSAYQYVLLASGVATLLMTALRMSRFYRSQVWAILFASSLPIAGNVIYLSNLNPISGMDWTPVTIMLAGVVLAWSIYRHRLFDLAPIARGTLVETMSDGVMVVDSRLRVADLNAAMASLLGIGQQDAIGRMVSDVARDIYSMLPASSHARNTLMEYCMNDGNGGRYFDLRVSPLNNRAGDTEAYIAVLRDITQRKRLEEERDELIGELRSTLREVRTLSGLLPICANCKSIRDDQGYWHSVEEYLGKHSEARFSYGICPDCVNKLYPDAGQPGE